MITRRFFLFLIENTKNKTPRRNTSLSFTWQNIVSFDEEQCRSSDRDTENKIFSYSVWIEIRVENCGHWWHGNGTGDVHSQSEMPNKRVNVVVFVDDCTYGICISKCNKNITIIVIVIRYYFRMNSSNYIRYINSSDYYHLERFQYVRNVIVSSLSITYYWVFNFVISTSTSLSIQMWAGLD